MAFLIGVFVVLHLLGMSAILGGWFADRVGAGKGLVALVWGARAQVLTGLGLVALHAMSQHQFNHAKVGVKLLVALAVVALAEITNARTRKGSPQPALGSGAVGLTLINVLIAVLWS